MGKESGLTLVELLVTIVVITIALAMGVPSAKEFIKNWRVTAQVNSFVTAIQTARNVAIKRGVHTTVCIRDPNNVDQCDAGTDWTNGWIVFSDLNRSQTPDETGTKACLVTEDCILRTTDTLNKSTLTGDAGSISFRPNGLAVNGPVTLSLVHDKCTRNQRRDIVITLQGHPSVTKENCP